MYPYNIDPERENPDAEEKMAEEYISAEDYVTAEEYIFEEDIAPEDGSELARWEPSRPPVPGRSRPVGPFEPGLRLPEPHPPQRREEWERERHRWPDGEPNNTPPHFRPDGGPNNTPPPFRPDGGPNNTPPPFRPDGGPNNTPPPFRPDGGPPDGPPHFRPDGQMPPGRPPLFTPKEIPGVFAVDPGAIRACMHNYTYIWLDNGQHFWMYPTFVGPRSVAGFRWGHFGWVFAGYDLRNVQSFHCTPW